MGGIDRAWLLFLLVVLALGLFLGLVAGLGLLRARRRRAGMRPEGDGSGRKEAAPDAWAEAGRRVQPYEPPREDPGIRPDGPSR